MFRNFELTELKVILSNLQSRHWAQGLPQGLLQSQGFFANAKMMLSALCIHLYPPK